MRVAVICGGDSAEREVSLLSGAAVVEALVEAGVDAVAVEADRNLWPQLAGGEFDAAFIALHGRGGEDGRVQALCELAGLAYTGSGILASALCMDKVRCNHELGRLGLSVPDFEEVGSDEPNSGPISRLGLPLVVKPVREGSTIGLSIAISPDQVQPALELARRHDRRVMAQRFVSGMEITVGVLDRPLRVLPPIEITYTAQVYDYQAKYTPGGSHHVIPARLPTEVLRRVEADALRAFVGLGCEGMARIDFIVDQSGTAFVLEVNTVPGLTPLSLFPDAARAGGIEFPELCLGLVQSALARSGEGR